MVLSAQVGSIGDNRLGGWYGYRMAKAALNMGIKTAAIEFERVRKAPVVCAVHPGTTATALSGPFIKRRRAAVTSVLETGERLAELALSLGPQDNGRFIKWDRSEIEW
jgi:NAD(P)-dependent dehydrogenase (short-subunit alcohol dehydrogenase family)